MTTGFCPERAECDTVAALLPISSLAITLGDNIGTFRFEQAFSNRLAPLIGASVARSLVAAAVVPMLRLDGKSAR